MTSTNESKLTAGLAAAAHKVLSGPHFQLKSVVMSWPDCIDLHYWGDSDSADTAYRLVTSALQDGGKLLRFESVNGVLQVVVERGGEVLAVPLPARVGTVDSLMC